MTQRMISRWGRRVFFGVPHHCGGGVYGCGGDASLVLCTPLKRNFIAVQMLSPLLSKLQQKDEIFF